MWTIIDLKFESSTMSDPNRQLDALTGHHFLGYLVREIKKDEIPILETGENPDAPQPREMIELEVIRVSSGKI